MRLCFVMVLVLFSSASSRAEVWESQPFNFAITLPLESGWTHVTLPVGMMKVSIRSADHTKVIAVSVSDIVPSISEEAFVKSFKDRWFEHSNGQAEERTQVDGRSAYRLTDIANLAGNQAHRVNTLVFESGKFYQIDAIGFGSDPMTDPAVRNCVASFRFLTQAPLPVTKPSSTDPADKLPERIADITIVVLIGLVAVFVLVKIVRKRRQ
ncbi:MAG: hypothetical protein JWN25_1724 [Verrucomicrobiales bacterium]|nr:hypothetical protein [Verrucomicrobiales bacterium]